MNQEEVYEYVKKSLDQGLSPGDIKGLLISDGRAHAWDVDVALKRINTEKGVGLPASPVVQKTPEIVRPDKTPTTDFDKRKITARKNRLLTQGIMLVLLFVAGSVYALYEQGYVYVNLNPLVIEIVKNREKEIMQALEKSFTNKTFNYEATIALDLPESYRNEVKKSSDPKSKPVSFYTLKSSGYVAVDPVLQFTINVTSEPDDLLKADFIQTDKFYFRFKTYPQTLSKSIGLSGLNNTWFTLGQSLNTTNDGSATKPGLAVVLNMNAYKINREQKSQLVTLAVQSHLIKNVNFLGVEEKKNQITDHYEFNPDYAGIGQYINEATKILSNVKVPNNTESLVEIDQMLTDEVFDLWISKGTGQIVAVSFSAKVHSQDTKNKKEIISPIYASASFGGFGTKRSIEVPKKSENIEEFFKKQTKLKK